MAQKMTTQMMNCLSECESFAVSVGEEHQKFWVPDVDKVQMRTAENVVPSYVAELDQKLIEAVGFGEGLKIAVIDTGCDFKHRENGALQNVAEVLNFTSDRDGYDFNGHGTWCLSAIGANGNGMTGILPKSTLYSLKALANDGGGAVTWIAAAILHAVRVLKVDVINLSLGGGYSQTIERACKEAEDAGIHVHASIGNSGRRGDGHPGNSDNTVGVGAMDDNDQPANFTSWSQKVEITDRGVNVPGASTNGGFARLSGTSMSGPVSAAKKAWAKAWLTKHWGQPASHADVEKAVSDNLREIGSPGWDNRTGHGQISLDNIAAKFPLSNSPDEPISDEPAKPSEIDLIKAKIERVRDARHELAAAESALIEVLGS